MTVRHLMAIALIYVGGTIAWFALGSSVVIRTGEFNQQLGADVALLWGPPHAQRAPEASLARPRQITETVVETKAGRVATWDVTKTVIDWSPFLTVMVVLDVLSGERLHPMNYFFISAAFFAFHLVAFSYAFFFEGLTGLAVTIGAVVTLFVLMQTTAGVNWVEVFATPAPRPVKGNPC